ncbi:hypothetical protein GLOIN_2v1845096 [Rhizophagus irregularis DAOM 181602=DAOM 197198]|nr:hypothetical protein GLOIN_2v1845096 [Rhizophagus irregularis DAOM 181602=DAOM 197198]
MTKKYSGTNDFFYLDVSIPFNLDSTLPIVDLSIDARQIYSHSNGISTICGPNKDTIFLIFRISEEGFSYYNFIINDQEWIPSTLETNVRWSSAVYTTSWGSVSSGLNITYLAPAILLPDGRIAYIGKSNIGDISFNFRNIYIYNTNDGTWRNMSTSGIEPSPRYFHTTVLTQDGLIIIYGGVNNIGPVPDQISVLDTKVDPFTWSIPNIDYAPSSAPFSGHTATLVGNYMIIAFGYYRTATTKSTVLSDQIHMIDVREKNNYKWVKNFTPLAYPTKSPGAAHAAIIGGTTGGIATVIIIISVSYLLYRKKRTIIYAPQAKHAINC